MMVFNPPDPSYYDRAPGAGRGFWWLVFLAFLASFLAWGFWLVREIYLGNAHADAAPTFAMIAGLVTLWFCLDDDDMLRPTLLFATALASLSSAAYVAGEGLGFLCVATGLYAVVLLARSLQIYMPWPRPDPDQTFTTDSLISDQQFDDEFERWRRGTNDVEPPYERYPTAPASTKAAEQAAGRTQR
jgi:hypothetical protein